MFSPFSEFASTLRRQELGEPVVPISLRFDGPRSQAPPAPPDRRQAAPPSGGRNNLPGRAGRGRECCPGAAARTCPTAQSPSSGSDRYRQVSRPPVRPALPRPKRSASSSRRTTGGPESPPNRERGGTRPPPPPRRPPSRRSPTHTT